MIPKFRAWISEADTMTNNLKGIDFENETVVLKKFYWEDGFPVEEEVFEVEIGNAIIMQSTGLVDKNGKEIFEGDVVKRYRGPFFKAKWEYQIETVIKEKASLLLGREFGKNFWTIPFDSPFAESVLLEVIGNIYENPELLEDKE